MMGASLDVAKELEHRREPDLIFCSHQTHIAITFAKQFSGRRIIKWTFANRVREFLNRTGSRKIDRSLKTSPARDTGVCDFTPYPGTPPTRSAKK